MSRFLIASTFWLLHWLPFPALHLLGWLLGQTAWIFLRRRRRIGLRNLELCFPEWSPTERQRVLKRHVWQLATTLLGYGILMYSSPARIKRIVRREGEEAVKAHLGKGFISLAPHFLGIDYAGICHSIDYGGSSMYSEQRLSAFDSLLLKTRSRFGAEHFKRSEGIRPVVRALKKGQDFYYLPDQDMGPRESIFVPFFGIPTATVPALARLAQLSGRSVLPVTSRLDWHGFVVQYHPVWVNFPTGDIEADTTRMNAFIEAQIRTMPSQYYWLHRRFKTRPEGAPSLYV